MPEISLDSIDAFKKAIEAIHPWIKDYWKEKPTMSKFKVGDRVRIVKWSGKWNWKDGTVIEFQVDKENPGPSEGWYKVKEDNGTVSGWWLHENLELVEETKMPQFKNGDKLRWKTPTDLEAGKFEPWDLKEKVTPIEKYIGTQMFECTKPYIYPSVKYRPTDSDPLGYRAHKPVNCAICNKEYSGPEQVNGVHIVGGMGITSPVPKYEPHQKPEYMILGPCCARKVDAFILELKTNAKPDTDRKNATNSWMPHDEDGNL